MIRIQNIYYMLSYAFSILHEEGYKKIASEDFDHISDLLAAILAKGISNQIRRGLGRVYINKIDAIRTLAGKIDLSQTIKQQSLYRNQLVCEFDEFSENSLLNQILKTTMQLLLKTSDVSKEQKKALRNNLVFFSEVDEIRPKEIKWSSLKYNHNNATYQMLVTICYLVIRGLLLTNQDGGNKLSEFLDDQQMHSLYEHFVLRYYQRHYPEFSVSASHIDWDVDNDIVAYLPLMKSDICIEHAGKTLIIDTKYYTKTMQRNAFTDSRTIHSGNLYQIFTYVKNKDIRNTGNVSGVLLYAKTEEEITPDMDYSISGNRILVKTLDLNTDFNAIKNQLDNLLIPIFAE